MINKEILAKVIYVNSCGQQETGSEQQQLKDRTNFRNLKKKLEIKNESP